MQKRMLSDIIVTDFVIEHFIDTIFYNYSDTSIIRLDYSQFMG